MVAFSGRERGLPSTPRERRTVVVGHLPNRRFIAGTEAGSGDQNTGQKCAKAACAATGPFACANLRFRPNIRPETGRVKGPCSGYLREGFLMMKRILAASAALAISATLAHAQEVKVGVNLPYTGIGAEFAQLIDRGMEMYLKLNADKVKPYKITLIKRDAKNPGGNDSRVATQELLTQDNVDILAGWVYSPNAIASAPVVNAGKKPAVIMNAGTAHITNMSQLLPAHLVQHVARRLRDRRSRRQAAQGQDRGGRLHRLPARQGQPDRLQALVRSQRRQGDRRNPDGRRRRGAGLHAVLPARQGQEARRVLRVRAGRRPRRRGGEDLRRARHEGRPASS